MERIYKAYRLLKDIQLPDECVREGSIFEHNPLGNHWLHINTSTTVSIEMITDTEWFEPILESKSTTKPPKQ